MIRSVKKKQEKKSEEEGIRNEIKNFKTAGFADKSHKSLRDLTYRSIPHKYDKKSEEGGIRTPEPTKGLDSS